MNVFVLLNTKEDILKNVGNRAVLDNSIIFPYYGSQWCPKTAWLQTFFKISSFVFSRTKKFIQDWIYLRMSKWWQDFHFWVNYPFKKHAKQCFLIIQKLTVVSGFHVSWVHSIGIIVFLLCKLYFLSPYPKPYLLPIYPTSVQVPL